jgi:hypothetical protein
MNWLRRIWPRREVQRLRVGPGDVVVLRAESNLTRDVIEQVAGQMKEAFPDNKIIVLADGSKMQVVQTGKCKGCGGREGDETETQRDQ